LSRQEISSLLDVSGPSIFLTDAAMVDVSATKIRAAARAGDNARLREMVPEAVANYIEKYELYQN
jgi:nicotinic acid mononucleotide adenylyltransferase